MKLDQLRTIIREEVRAAIKDELQEVMNEAVKVASTPSTSYTEIQKPKDSNLKWSTAPKGQPTSLEEMLQNTAKSLTPSEASNILGTSNAPSKPNFASNIANQMAMQNGDSGVSFADIPGFDPAKAKAILEAANSKDKTRKGL